MKSDFSNKLKWFRKKLTWNYKYLIGKWNYMGEEELRYDKIVEFIKSCEIEKVTILDLGCGYGALNRYLASEKYEYCLGVDLSKNAISKAKKQKYKKSSFLVADIHKFIPNKKFDIIIFNEVLYYLDNQMEVVEKYAKYLNDDGYFIFSFYKIRADLTQDLNKRYELLKTDIVNQSDSVYWGISLYKVK